MKDTPTYYEILDVAPDASFSDIRTAFRELQSIYDKDSLSTYSLFTPDQRRAILDQAEAAFLTLTDGKKRADYDRLLRGQGKLFESVSQKPKAPEPVFSTQGPEQAGQAVRQMREKTQNPEFLALKARLTPGALVSGRDLKDLRGAASVTLADIFEMSRVSVSVLRAIEGEDRANLPPEIYLKGFLKSYAQCLGLDPGLVVSGYLSHLSKG